MGKNQEGYGAGMGDALEEARAQKGKDAALRRKNQGLPLTRGNHDDLEREIKALSVNNDNGNATRARRRSSTSKGSERVKIPGEMMPVSGNVQTIFHGQYGGQWKGGR